MEGFLYPFVWGIFILVLGIKLDVVKASPFPVLILGFILGGLCIGFALSFCIGGEICLTK